MSLAMHVNVPAVLIQLKSSRCINLSRCLNNYLRTTNNCVVSVYIPLVNGEIQTDAKNSNKLCISYRTKADKVTTVW